MAPSYCADLALGALDDGAIGTVRCRQARPSKSTGIRKKLVSSSGSTTRSARRSISVPEFDGWNSRLKLIRAAVKAGARVLMTSRTYIWNAAQRDLKLSEFPLFTNSQVIIDVQGLSDLERAQILYNHVRRGDQPSEWRKRLKGFLAAIATNRHFLPETARRLGSIFFTAKLNLKADEINAFFEEPLEFLKDVLRR